MSVIVDGTNGLIFNDASTQTTAATGFGFKNRIINGDMRVAQRGTTTGVGIDMFGGCDRWKQWAADGGESGRCTMSQSTDAPAGFAYSQQLAVTTAQTSISAGHAYQLVQRIETLNCQDLGFGQASKYIRVSFWAKSSKAGVYNVTMYFAGASSNKVNVREVTLSSTWTKYTLTFVTDSTQAVTSSTNSYGLIFGIGLMAGSTWRSGTTSDTWSTHSGANWFTNNQVNFYDSTSNTLNITGVQLEKGSTATDFDYRDYSTELRMCQRYFVKYLGNNIYESAPFTYIIAVNSTQAYGPLCPPNVMRTAFSISTSGTLALVDAGNAYTISSIVNSGGNYSGPWQMEVYVQTTGMTAYRTHYLRAGNSTNSYIYLSAEL